MTDEQHQIILAAGLEPDYVTITGYVAADDDNPAILSGLHSLIGRQPAFAAIQAHRNAAGWEATAFLSATNPGLPIEQLDPHDLERLRHANLDVDTPDGPKPASEVAAPPVRVEDPGENPIIEGEIAHEEILPPEVEATPLPPGFGSGEWK